MPVLLCGEPEEAAAQLIAICEKKACYPLQLLLRTLKLIIEKIMSAIDDNIFMLFLKPGDL